MLARHILKAVKAGGTCTVFIALVLVILVIPRFGVRLGLLVASILMSRLLGSVAANNITALHY